MEVIQKKEMKSAEFSSKELGPIKENEQTSLIDNKIGNKTC